MTVKFPGEIAPPTRPNLEENVALSSAGIGGVEKYGAVSVGAVALSDVLLKTGDTMTGNLILSTGNLEMNGGAFIGNRISINATYNTTGKEFILACSHPSAITVTLASNTVEAGRVLIIKDESGSALTNNISVVTEGSETIDGSASTSIMTNYGEVRLYSDGTDWFSF